MDVVETARTTIAAHRLADGSAPVLLMVSGGSDSTALAYIAAELAQAGVLGPLALLHVNHLLRGDDADADARFAACIAHALGMELFARSIDVGAIAAREGANVEAVARRERYQAAHEALGELCRRAGAPIAQGRVFTAHTADDRVESFFMRSIVGTGPGGFRSMLYLNGQVARPLLEVGRADLRAFVEQRADRASTVRDAGGALWREDATNEHTDRFRAFVRMRMVPAAKERNPRLLETLTRTMNLIADEDDMLDAQAAELEEKHVAWIEDAEASVGDYGSGCVLAPALAQVPRPLARRVCKRVLERMLGYATRVENAAVDAVLDGFLNGKPKGGYVTNIQGDLAVSANKHGVRIEPMAAFRMRRNRL